MFYSKTIAAELESTENAAGHNSNIAEPDKESWEKTNSGTYSDSTEQCESSDSKNTSDGSLENSEIPREDPNKSLENLLNDLESSNEDSNSPENLDGTILEMDQDESGDESPKIGKNNSTFSTKKIM